jgi:phage shock protein E
MLLSSCKKYTFGEIDIMAIWHLALGIGVGYFLFRRFLINKADYRKLVNEGAMVIDVRSPTEFAQGHIAQSRNIPLGDLQAALPQLMGKTVIAVCASGMRSGNACAQMKRAGITCYNGGSWGSLNRQLS